MENPIYIIGMGSQAKAWSMNFKDSGLKFSVLLRKNSSNWDMAIKKGHDVLDMDKFKADRISTFILLTGDHVQGQIVEDFIHSHKALPNSHFIFAHGISVIKNNLKERFPNYKMSLLAPKAIASELRFRYETQEPLAAIYESSEETKQEILKIMKALGISAHYQASFEQETHADLFSEQSLLCSLIPYGILSSYNLLRERGIPKELAFIECFMESKLIIDALLQYGPKDFFDLISPNALVGGEWANEVIFDKNGALQKIFNELAEQVFNGEFMAKLDSTNFKEIRENVKQRWSNEELQETYENLKTTLIQKGP